MGSEATSGATSEATQVATQEQLMELFTLFLDINLRYLKAVSEGKVRPSVKRLAVVRDFLRDSGMTVDTAHVEDVAASLEKLGSMGLPFPTQKPSL